MAAGFLPDGSLEVWLLCGYIYVEASLRGVVVTYLPDASGNQMVTYSLEFYLEDL